MEKFPTMVYRDGDTSKEYRVASNEDELKFLLSQGFAAPGEDVAKRRGRPPSNG